MKLLCQNNTKLLGWTSMHGALQKGYSTLVPIWFFIFSADSLTVCFAFSQFLQLRHSQYVFSQKATINVQGGHAELHAKAWNVTWWNVSPHLFPVSPPLHYQARIVIAWLSDVMADYIRHCNDVEGAGDAWDFFHVANCVHLGIQLFMPFYY